MHQRVSSADRGPNLRHQKPALTRHLQNFPERYFEVLLDVVTQRLQWRNVEDLGAVLQTALQSFTHEPINAGEKRGEGLAGTRRCGDEGGATRQNVWPALLLRFGRCAETLDKPFPDERVGPVER